MKRFLSLLAISAAIIGFSSACHTSKGKEATRPAGDTVVRHYHTKPVKKPVTIKIADGLEYTVISEGDGPLPQKGDKIVVLYTGRFTNDTIFDASSRNGYQPLPFHLKKPEVIAGWDSVFSRLHGGDKATMTIAPQYGYGAMQHGKIPGNSTLKFEVEVINIIPKPTPWDAKGKDTITTKSGLKVVMFETHPENEKAQTGKTVSVHYSGYLLDGTMFDSSVERGQPYSFQLGVSPVIKGWVEGIGMLHKGEKAQLIIPYTLGYGAQGRPPVIPPKATMIFDVQLVDIK